MAGKKSSSKKSSESSILEYSHEEVKRKNILFPFRVDLTVRTSYKTL
jgi:hypothetical protein